MRIKLRDGRMALTPLTEEEIGFIRRMFGEGKLCYPEISIEYSVPGKPPQHTFIGIKEIVGIEEV